MFLKFPILFDTVTLNSYKMEYGLHSSNHLKEFGFKQLFNIQIDVVVFCIFLI